MKWLLFLIFTYLSSFPPAMAVTPSGVYPIQSYEVGANNDDLTPFSKMIEGAEFVGLGEAVHTSEGFYQAKLRLISYLVENKGFRAIGWETPWKLAETTDSYLQSCNGTSTAALDGILNVWDSPVVAELFQWLCSWNENHPKDRVHLYGFDPQAMSVMDLTTLETFFKKAAPNQASKLMTEISDCFGFGMAEIDYENAALPIMNGEGEIASATNESCNAGIQKLESYISHHKIMMIIRSSIKEVKTAQTALIALDAFQKQLYLRKTDVNGSYEARDDGMAALAVQMREEIAPGLKTILWAHNEHLMMNHAVAQLQFPGTLGMGAILEKRLGKKYVPIGISAYSIGVHWPGTDPQQIPTPSLTDSVEGILHSQGLTNSFVNLSDSFLDPQKTYMFGDDGMIPAQQFRGLLVMENSEPMTIVTKN
jgi:erythromycin esterase-like protein